jgi:hypothetical protein
MRPIPNSPNWGKSNEALRYIIRDASEAAKAMRGHDPIAECKYLDQMNDAATVLAWRKRMALREQLAKGGKPWTHTE